VLESLWVTGISKTHFLDSISWKSESGFGSGSTLNAKSCDLTVTRAASCDDTRPAAGQSPLNVTQRSLQIWGDYNFQFTPEIEVTTPVPFRSRM
jgi:hypothetical protein